MMSQAHQLMSQGNQVVETTLGQSQELLKTSETAILTQSLSTRSQDATQ